MKDFNVGILTAAHKSILRGARQNYKLERLDEELSEARREAETNPSQYKTVTYNIPRPEFSGTSYTSGGKAGVIEQHHTTWRKMVLSCGD